MNKLTFFFLVATRHLQRNTLHSLINISGLAIGLASSVLILLYAMGELTFDSGFANGDHIYRIERTAEIGGNVLSGPFSPPVAGKAILESFPEVISQTRYTVFSAVIKTRQDPNVSSDYLTFVDENFLDLFEYGAISGDAAAALRDNYSIVLTKSLAGRLFGQDEPLGSTVTIKTRAFDRTYVVGAVIEDAPANSHFAFSMLARFDQEAVAGDPLNLDTWMLMGSSSTYLVIRPGTDIPALETRISEFLTQQATENAFIQDENYLAYVKSHKWQLRPLGDLHFLSRGTIGFKAQGNRDLVMTLLAIAGLIMAITCINYSNLSAAMNGARIKEMTLRRVYGASRKQLVIWYFGESILNAAIAFVIALLLIELALPWYNALLGGSLSLFDGDVAIRLPWIFGLAVVAGLLGGIYPAFLLSRASMARNLAYAGRTGTSGGDRARWLLVTLQFSLSIGLMVCAAVILKQTQLALATGPSQEARNFILLRGNNGMEAMDNIDLLATEIEALPEVIGTSKASTTFADNYIFDSVGYIPRDDILEPVKLSYAYANQSFFDNYGLKLVAGRPLRDGDEFARTPLREPDTVQPAISVTINENAVEALGFATPEAAIGQSFRMFFGFVFVVNPADLPLLEIVGVHSDSHAGSLRNRIAPLIYAARPSGYTVLSARLDAENSDQVLADIRKIWTTLNPSAPFNFSFMDDSIRAEYKTEILQRQLLIASSVIALIITCLGIFGLASFAAERQRKEISIRKILGGTTQDIVKLVLMQFSKPVLLANLIAWPPAWWIMRDWLDGFAYRIDLSAVYFVSAGMAALTVAWGTIAVLVFRAAQRSPANELRHH